MFFLLRMAFWLSVVLILLPSGGAQRQPAGEVGASDAVSAASDTVHDLKGFCTREPNACTVGSRLVVAMGYRAQAGAKMLYDFLTEAVASKDSPNDTGSLGNGSAAATGRSAMDRSAMHSSPLQKASQNTLTPTDLAPAWRGPAPRKNVRHAV
jgi:hypothetical protein